MELAFTDAENYHRDLAELREELRNKRDRPA
jgi:hypothetical protein